jgi:EAL domain-containing protein (putative c-di-GMP-specific phosphodiesterase class I)/GGDEF domain-containing protein
MIISCQLTEARRLEALRQLNLLDTPPAEAFDRITRMAARVFDLPVAAISLTDVDRQWFKSRVGIEHTSIARMRAPCSEVTNASAVLVVPDLLEDAYYRDSPLAADGIRYYAGAPLVTADGHCLGAICVLGRVPRTTTDEEIAALHDLAGMVMAQIELQHALGRIDAVSSLPNRHQFIEDFQDLQRDRPQGEQRYVVLINLASPEQLSYAVRVMSSSYLDELVTDAARWLRGEIDAARVIYHVATAQFALFSPPGVALADYLAVITEKLRRCMQFGKGRYVTTPAVGLAPFEVGRAEGASVLRRAQSAAHDALACPSHAAVYSPQADAIYQRRFTLLNEFGAALEAGGQLRLVFQPRVDLRSGRCVGAEALLRWQHSELGGVGPGEFMPVIERSSLAQATTAWVLTAALEQQRRWRAQGLMLQLSVNVSPANLLDDDFADRLAAGLAAMDLPPDCMELEITESALMEQVGAAHAMLEAISATGVRLAIDDFGTGYSSLSYLQSMPADVVKIDQSFMRGLEADPRKQALVTTMIRLSQDLGHRVVAEGVETEWAERFLREVACDEAQGYLYARPMEPEDFTRWRAAYFMPLMSA